MKKYFILFICFLFTNTITSQRNCGTMQYLQEQINANPNLIQRMNDNELNLKNYIENSPENNSSTIITIPVVIHVVYYNTNENISDQQILSQIDILNEDFRRLNADAINTPLDFQSVAADTEIEFCLASEDPNGNSTSGITRTQTSQSSFSTNDGVKYSSSGGVDAWNTSDYLNIWVCDLSGGLLGYAQFPGGTTSSDGVVCDYAYFGNIGTATTPYHLGRTLTHEVGHWLNLRHIWGDQNCGDDLCNDTPEHSGSNYSCPNYPSTSSCSGNGNYGDMFMNYMDYTDDACMNMFTQDQKTRMISSINSFRSDLLTSNGCTNADYGCTDLNAFNYSSVAIIDDGSCCYIDGCTDITAVNYDSLVCFDDGSCIAPVLGCTNPNATNFDPNANTTISFGGATDNTFGTGGYFNGNQYLIFDSYKNCVIKSAIVYVQSSNTITFELRNSSGTVLDDTTLTLATGQHRIPLNLEVPIGNDFQLGISAINSGLYRNNASANYPYDIASAINITSSSATSTPFGYYYFFYDIEVETPCNVISNFSWDCDGQGSCYDPGTGSGQFSSLTQCQSSCIVPSWDCDGQGNCYDPGTGSGQFSSLTQCQSSCIVPSWDCDGQGNCYDPGTGNGYFTSLFTCEENCILNNIDYEEISEIRIFPNPTDNLLNISFNSNQQTEIKLFNYLGELVYSNYVFNKVGQNDIVIEFNSFSKGVYLLRILNNTSILHHKIIFE